MKANMKLHERAVSLCRERRRVEFALIEVLQEIDAAKLYRAFECTSLFKYAVDVLGMSESTAYAFISVARKAKAIPELQRTLRAQSLSVRKALRAVSILDRSNAAELIEFAISHSSRELDREIARRSPQALKRQSVRPVSAEYMNLNTNLHVRVFEKLKRVQDLMGENDLEKVLEAVLDEYIERKDPVRKAQRAKLRAQTKNNPPAKRPVKRVTYGRTPLSASQRHEVNARDHGRCTYTDGQGRRCENERWLQLHHIRPVSEGGSNAPENVQTLCASHHDLVHQMSFQIRSPQIPYALPMIAVSGTRRGNSRRDVRAN